jgi:hypothetical protein
MPKSQSRFTDYRYYKARYHFTPKIALKIEVNHDTDTILFAFAVCSREDNFSRKVARELLDKRITDHDRILGGLYDREKTLLDNCIDIVNRVCDTWDKLDQKFYDRKFEHDVRSLRKAFIEIGIQKGIDVFEDAFNQMLDNPSPGDMLSLDLDDYVHLMAPPGDTLQ